MCQYFIRQWNMLDVGHIESGFVMHIDIGGGGGGGQNFSFKVSPVVVHLCAHQILVEKLSFLLVTQSLSSKFCHAKYMLHGTGFQFFDLRFQFFSLEKLSTPLK